MIYLTPKLTGQAQGICAQIDELRDTLKHRVGQSKQWTGVLSRWTFARNIKGSNTIEGYNVTEDDAVGAVAEDQPMTADQETWYAVCGYRDAMTYVLQLADDPNYSCGPELLRSLHFMMMRHDFAKSPGRWRPGVVYVRNEQAEVVYDPPDVELVPSLINDLVAWLNAAAPEEHPIARAAMGHLNLTLIHPFADGNGRMARCLQSLMLARQGLLGAHFCSIEEYLGRNRQAYYDALTAVAHGKWSPHRSAFPFVKFCLTAHYRQAHTLLRRVRITERVWEQLSTEISRRKLPDRVQFALADAAFGYRVTNPRYRKVADISNNLASRDLQTLVNEKLLVPKGERRGRFYERSAALKAIWEQARETGPIADPFEEEGSTSSPSAQQPLFPRSTSAASRKAS